MIILNRDLIRIISMSLNSDCVKLSEEPDWNTIKSDAKRHGITAALYLGMSFSEMKGNDILQEMQSEYYQELRWDIVGLKEVARIQNVFDENGIYSIALKGCNTKKRYPQTIIRSMGDIDILIKPEQNKQVHDVMKELGYTYFEEGRKHDRYRNNNKITVEIHRDLLAAESEYYNYFDGIWDNCHLKIGCKYTYEMTMEDEYIFNILHLIEHFKNGGIGIRFIMDVYVYNRLVTMDKAYINSEFDSLAITGFVGNIVDLADFWFGKACFDCDKRIFLNRLGEYVYNGGAFGSLENAASLKTAHGKGRFFIDCMFPKYDSMVSIYPWLKGKKYLLFIAWMVRAVRAFFFKKRKCKNGEKIY